MIRESFTAAKAGKVDVREKRKNQTKEAELTLDAHKKQVQLLQSIAEYSGIDLEVTIMEEQVKCRPGEISAQLPRPTTRTQKDVKPRRTIAPKRTLCSSVAKDNIQQDNSIQTAVPKHPEKIAGSIINATSEESCDASYAHSCLQCGMPTVSYSPSHNHHPVY